MYYHFFVWSLKKNAVGERNPISLVYTLQLQLIQKFWMKTCMKEKMFETNFRLECILFIRFEKKIKQ